VENNYNGSGIYLSNSDYNTIENDNFRYNWYGIYIDSGADNNTFLANVVENSSSEGVYLESSENNRFILNTIDNNGSDGIYIYEAWNTVLENNLVENNWAGIDIYDSYNTGLDNNRINNSTNYNFGVFGYAAIHYIHDIDNTNLVNGKPIIYLVGENNIVINQDNNIGYLGLVNLHNARVENVVIGYNYQGILLAAVTNSHFENLVLENNDYGISLFESDNNTVLNSTLDKNAQAISLRNSDNNTISNITATNNSTYGVIIEDSSTYNDVTNNTIGGGATSLIRVGSSSNYNTIDNNLLENSSSRGIQLLYVNNNVVSNNTIDNVDRGVYLSDSDNNTITNNTIENCSDKGIFLQSSDNNTITSNTIDNCSDKGIFLNDSDGNTISNNTVGTCGTYGIYQMNSSQNNYLYPNTYDNLKGFLTISSVASSNVGTNSATITWTTSVSANSKVEYGTSTSYGSSVSSASNVTSHSLSITGIVSSTLFHFRVWSADCENNNWVITGDYTFTTTGLPTPTISSSTHTEGVTSSNASPSFSWSQVGDSDMVDFKYMLYPYESSWKSTNSTSVSYLGVPDGTYIFKLKAYDGGGESGVDEYTITIDTTPSTIELSGAAAGATETATGWSLTTTQSTFTLSGRVEPGAQVTINGASVSVAGDGSFSKTFTLSPGQNVFTIRVVDTAGNITEKTLTVNYSPTTTPTVVAPPVSPSMMSIIAVIILIFVIVGVVFSFTRPRK